MGKRKPRKIRNSEQSYNKNNPFTGDCLGNFTSIEVVDIAVDATLKGVEAGAQLTRDTRESEQSEIPKWAIIIYILILIFAVLVIILPFFEDYSQSAWGYIFGQAPLLLKSKTKVPISGR